MSLKNAIQQSQGNLASIKRTLQIAIWDALVAAGFGDVKAASIAIVNGHEVIQTAYFCVDDLENPEGSPDCIEIGGDIGPDSIVLY